MMSAGSLGTVGNVMMSAGSLGTVGNVMMSAGYTWYS